MSKTLSRKLQHWHDAGLVSAQQITDILAFEAKHKQGRLTQNLTFIGFFAIILGMISIVAANWNAIPDFVKLGGHFILNLGIACAMLRINTDEKPLRKDGFTLLLAGLFLSFIALIGQVFQLHGDLHITFAFWLLICSPFIWYYGKTPLIASPWLTLSVIILFWNMIEFFDKTPNIFWMSASGLAIFLPLLLLSIGRSKWMTQYKTGFADTFEKMALAIPAIAANIALFLFYNDDRVLHQPYHMAVLALGMTASILCFRKNKTMLPYLACSNLLIALPFILPFNTPLLPALLFILYWGFMAWIGTRIASDNLINWSIRLIVLRLFIIYLEVFGGMLFTGIGLILSGIFLLLVLRHMNRLVTFGRKLIGHDIS